MKYHSEPLCDLYLGDARQILSELSAESVNCVVTSPPYWSLRKYSGEQEGIWGGKEGCEHEWGKDIVVKGEIWRKEDLDCSFAKSQPTRTTSHAWEKVENKSQFCSLCGAWKGALGLEPTPELYIQHTIEILRAIRRVLRNDGVVGWNIGDSMAGSWQAMSHDIEGKGKRTGYNEYPPTARPHPILKPLDCCLIPFRVAIAAQEDGWYVRQVIIWQKNNPMPESMNGWRWERHRLKVKNRTPGTRLGAMPSELPYHHPGQVPHRDGSFSTPSDTEWQDCPGCPKCLPNDGYVLRKGAWRPTDDYEFILMLTKTDRYWCDQDAVRETQANGTFKRYGKNPVIPAKRKWSEQQDKGGSSNTEMQEHIENTQGAMVAILPSGRNLRSVWSFPTQPYPEAHFATFPEELPRRCILASCPAYVCPKCGAPWARVVKKKASTMNIRVRDAKRGVATPEEGYKATEQEIEGYGQEEMGETQSLGWRATCRCGIPQEQTIPGVVLDPFVGSGTTGAVAKSLGRRSIGIDISEKYMGLSLKRIGKAKTPLMPVTEKG